MLFNFYQGQAWQTQYLQGLTGAQRNMIWFRNKLVKFEFHTFSPKDKASTYKTYIYCHLEFMLYEIRYCF